MAVQLGGHGEHGGRQRRAVRRRVVRQVRTRLQADHKLKRNAR